MRALLGWTGLQGVFKRVKISGEDDFESFP